jgi:hypothetical protein
LFGLLLVVSPEQSTAEPLADELDEPRTVHASARPAVANVATVTASISPCRPVNSFGFADFIFIPNPGQTQFGVSPTSTN